MRDTFEGVAAGQQRSLILGEAGHDFLKASQEIRGSEGQLAHDGGCIAMTAENGCQSLFRFRQPVQIGRGAVHVRVAAGMHG